jgi:hypothetical protein
MLVIELLKISVDLLKTLSRNDVLIDDWRYVEVYDRFKHMRKSGVKHSVAIRILSDELGVGQRTIERAFKRLSKEC